jgi:TRAP-type mannitol/chloroaromatic compound transport system substrate-binding protein
MQDAVTPASSTPATASAPTGTGRTRPFSLFGTPPALGWEANNFLGWMNYGGGYDLYNELVQGMLKLNLVGFLSGPQMPQPLAGSRSRSRRPRTCAGSSTARSVSRPICSRNSVRP